MRRLRSNSIVYLYSCCFPRLCRIGMSRRLRTLVILCHAHRSRVQQRPRTTASSRGQDQPKLASQMAKHRAACSSGRRSRRTRYVPDRRSARGQPRSLTVRRSSPPQVTESPGDREPAPQTSQADSTTLENLRTRRGPTTHADCDPNRQWLVGNCLGAASPSIK
jgi:hypothetical protein